MKKFIAVILVLVLLFSIACINVFATTNSQKLSGELLTMISNSKDDDVLPVCVFFHNYKTLVDMKSYPDHDKSIEEMKLYIKDFKADIMKNVFDGIIIQNVILDMELADFLILELKVKDIIKISENPKVCSIDYFVDYIDEPEGFLFYDRFVEEYDCEFISLTPNEYKELYYEYEGSGIEWGLIFAQYNICPWEMYNYGVFGDTFIKGGVADTKPWSLSFGVYNVKEDKFYDIKDLSEEPIFETIKKVLLDQGYAKIIGDMDLDGEITILDALNFQKCLVNQKSFDINDILIGNICVNDKIGFSYVSDFNRDGNRDIVDATSIQKKLACID